MEKNITQISKRISDIKNINKTSFEGGAVNEEIIILTQIAKLKRFKYEEYSYLHFVKEISNMKMMTIGIQQNRFKFTQQESEIKLINSVLELYLMVIEILVGYLDRNEQRSNKLTFVEEKKNRLCPICAASIEQNKLSNIRKGIDATWVSALKFVSILPQNEQNQNKQTEQNHQIDEEIIDDEDYIKMIDKILSSKTLYTSKKSYTSAVLQETFNLNVQRRVEDMNATLTDTDVRSAKDAMDYAMKNLQFEFKDQMIENLVPVLYRLVMKYRDAEKKKHQAEFLNIDTQTDQFNEVKQLKLLQQKAQVMYRNLYHKTNQVQQLKKTVKKLQNQNKSSTNQLEITVKQLIIGNKLLTQTKRKLQIQILKYQEQVSKLQKQIHDFQILQSRRNSNRKSSVLSNKIFLNQQQIDQIQNENAQEKNQTNHEINETDEVSECIVKIQTERSNFKISNTFIHTDRDKSSVSKSKNSQSQFPSEQNNNQMKSKIKPIRNVSNKINLLSYNRNKDKQNIQIDKNQQLGENNDVVEKQQKSDKKQSFNQIKQRIRKQPKNNDMSNHHNTIQEKDEEMQNSAQNSTVILSNSISMKNSMIKKKGSKVIEKSINNPISRSNKSSNLNSEHSLNANDNQRESYISNTTKKNFTQHISKKNKKQNSIHQDNIGHHIKNKQNHDDKQANNESNVDQQHTYQKNLYKKSSNTHHQFRTKHHDSINQSSNDKIGHQIKHKQSLNHSQQSSLRNSQQYIYINNYQNEISSWQSQHPSLEDIDFDNFDQTLLQNYSEQKQVKILARLSKRNQQITKKSYQTQESSFNNQVASLPYNGHSLHSSLNTGQHNYQYNQQNMNKTVKKHNKVSSDVNGLRLNQHSTTLETLYHSSLPSKRQQIKTFKLFNSKDLNQLFGSVEQAYQLQSSKSQSKLKITTRTKQFIQQVFDHVNSIKKNNIDLYDWIKSFLKFPYQTAINNNNSSDLASNLSKPTFEFYFGRMLSLHQKCRPATNRKFCHHLKGFLSKIKFKLQQSDKNSINLPLIDKK